MGDYQQKLDLKTKQVENLKSHYESQISDLKHLHSRDVTDHEK